MFRTTKNNSVILGLETVEFIEGKKFSLSTFCRSDRRSCSLHGGRDDECVYEVRGPTPGPQAGGSKALPLEKPTPNPNTCLPNFTD